MTATARSDRAGRERQSTRWETGVYGRFRPAFLWGRGEKPAMPPGSWKRSGEGVPPWGSQRRPYCGFRRTACRCYAGRVSPFRCGFRGVGVALLCPRELKNEVRAGVPPTPPVAIPLAYGLYPPAFFRHVVAVRCMFPMRSRRCPRVVSDMPIAVGDSYPGTIHGCLGAPLFSCRPCGKNARLFRP